MISKKDIDLIKKKINMVELAKEYTELKLAGDGIWQGICPHPSHKDDTPSFIVWDKSSSWACMGCHNGKKSENHKIYGSDCIAFIQWIEGVSWKKAIDFLAKKACITLTEDPNKKIYDANKTLALAYMKNKNKSILQYLHSRGLTDRSIQEWMIGFDGTHITFPLFNANKDIIGFSRRNMKNYGSKYINSRSSDIFQKNNYLYGLHNIDDEFNEIRITEGAMDVILAYQNGAKNVVCTLGTSFTENHAIIIKNIGMTPVLCMDGDNPGKRSAEKASEYLSNLGVYPKILDIKNNMDLAELSILKQKNIEEYISINSRLYSYTLIESFVNNYDSKINEFKISILPEILDILKNIKSDNEKKILTDFIKERLNINV